MIDFLFGTPEVLGLDVVYSWWQMVALAVANGLSARSEAKQRSKDVTEGGREDRRTLAFKYDMEDYMKQKDKYQRSKGLENYAAWSRLDEYAPEGFQGSQNVIEKPVKPKPEGY